MSKRTDQRRRRFLVKSTTAVAGMGAAMSAVPFVAAWNPSARARAAGAPVTMNIATLRPGEQTTVAWRGKPVWILHRSGEMRDALAAETQQLRDADSAVAAQQPPYATNSYRSRKPEHLVVVALCTHLGCVPMFRPDVAPPDLGPDWSGGYFCPCHGSRFDLAGRVFRGAPAPLNLLVPPYHYVEDAAIEIGRDQRAT